MVSFNKEEFLNELYEELLLKKAEDPKISYTSFLIKNEKILAKKIGEESCELLIELLKKNKRNFINECADLLYHVLVAFVFLDIKPNQVIDELKRRTKQSGIVEKKNRIKK